MQQCMHKPLNIIARQCKIGKRQNIGGGISYEINVFLPSTTSSKDCLHQKC